MFVLFYKYLIQIWKSYVVIILIWYRGKRWYFCFLSDGHEIQIACIEFISRDVPRELQSPNRNSEKWR